ncbi:dTDP-glucose 4,6-dehydratase [Virgibacillus sp. W0181]|uniref:dTDP-glucose 4,6-dehydratase n=1 Tax=Virgibacillus sp. W0181 TaxID=3391581 RepID=UPI003F484282
MNLFKPTLLVTGGAGFIGSNFITYYMNTYPDMQVLNLDKLTYAGNLENVKEVEKYPNYRFIQCDLTNAQLVEAVFEEFDITGVINFAAESHVDRSIDYAGSFVESNVLGTNILLEAAKQSWSKKGELSIRRFHHISTDEVYGSLGRDGKFTEKTPYNPRNPYSASKAGSDMLVKSFGHTYGMNVIISNSSNNYGPKQHTEKLIPTIILNALKLEPIPLYGDGKNVRDWLYVEDHCRAVDHIYHNAKPMETYNIGGANEQTNIDVASRICEILDYRKPELLDNTSVNSFKDLIIFTEDRKGHDRRYAIDDSKLRINLDWEPKTSLMDGLEKTVDWYVSQWETVIA